MNDGIIHYRGTAAAARTGRTELADLSSVTADGLDMLMERTGERLADLRRTVELVGTAQAAMESGDVDWMVAVAATLRQRIAARHAALAARQAA